MKGEISAGGYLYNQETDVILYFLFCHAKIPFDPSARVQVEIVDSKDLNISEKTTIGLETLILMNSDAPLYSILYRLKFDIPQKEVRLIVEDLPEIGAESLTQEEMTSITLTF